MIWVLTDPALATVAKMVVPTIGDRMMTGIPIGDSQLQALSPHVLAQRRSSHKLHRNEVHWQVLRARRATDGKRHACADSVNPCATLANRPVESARQIAGHRAVRLALDRLSS